MYHKQNAGQNHIIKAANKSLENVAIQIFGNDKLKKKIACMKKFKVD
jgi:hypothetical protein